MTSSSNVHIGAGVLERAGSLLARHTDERRLVIVTDSLLKRSILPGVVPSLEKRGFEVAIELVARGEKAKSFACIERLQGRFLKRRVERLTPILALGGGALGDAVGFAAASFYRGVPWVGLPTTLLAQVDSSIGGKTAIDHPLAKNAVGAFHQPLCVLSDVSVLSGLPRRQLLAGLAEVVKIALLFDAKFGSWLERNWTRILSLEPRCLTRLVRTAVDWKLATIAGDERDLRGRRELLNFGHTLGHALEVASGYRLLHGEAVAWGMRAALALARSRGFLARDDWATRTADALLARLPAPRPAGLETRAVLDALRSDKKVRGGRRLFILLRAVGQAIRVSDVSDAELEQVLHSLGLA